MISSEMLAAPTIQAVRDAAWAMDHALDDLRDSYFSVAAALDRLVANSDGSSSPLLARAARCWGDALAITDEAGAALDAGLDHLRLLPDATPVGSMDEVITALTVSRTDVDRVIELVVELRDRVAGASRHLPAGSDSPTIGAAREQWVGAAESLDLLAARLQLGSAALTRYADAVATGDPAPRVDAPVIELLSSIRGPAGAVVSGAAVAGELIRAVPGNVEVTTSTGRQRPVARWLAAMVGRRAASVDHAGPVGRDCAATLLCLVQADLTGYDRRLRRLARQGHLHWYAATLAAAFVLAVHRRFRPGQDRIHVNRFVADVRRRYNPDGGLLTSEAAEQLIHTALGDSDTWHEPDQPASPDVVARLVLIQSLLLIGLLTDEGLDRPELDGLLADAARIAATVGPAPSEP